MCINLSLFKLLISLFITVIQSVYDFNMQAKRWIETLPVTVVVVNLAVVAAVDKQAVAVVGVDK